MIGGMGSMNTFEYYPAKTVKEACDLLSQYGEDAKILGGGQSLVTLMKQNLVSPSYLIDIKDISELDYMIISAMTMKMACGSAP
jgi:carbon-monoxide dehydrogenase medium subunit